MHTRYRAFDFATDTEKIPVATNYSEIKSGQNNDAAYCRNFNGVLIAIFLPTAPPEQGRGNNLPLKKIRCTFGKIAGDTLFSHTECVRYP